jgi:hypothetical protein
MTLINRKKIEGRVGAPWRGFLPQKAYTCRQQGPPEANMWPLKMQAPLLYHYKMFEAVSGIKGLLRDISFGDSPGFGIQERQQKGQASWRWLVDTE